MASDAKRPYFNQSIAQLEGLFQKSRLDPVTLQALDHELSFRSTSRATKLRKDVADAIGKTSRKKGNAKVSSSLNVSSSENEATRRMVSPNPIDQHPPFSSKTSEEEKTSTDNRDPPTLDLDSFITQMPLDSGGATSILAAWIAFEALSPQTYRRPEDLVLGDRRCVADLTGDNVPWARGERSRPKKQLYYQVVLGAISMDRATEDLVKAFDEDEERNPRIREKASIAAVLVDRNGLLVEENGISVSSFAWALPLALKLKLGVLKAWPKIEPVIIEKLDNILRRADDKGEPIPLDLSSINRAHRWITAQFGLPAHLVEPPTFALRVYHYYKAKNPPEALLLNSFFLNDLAQGASLVNENAAPTGLRRYLGIEKPTQTFDLFADKTTLERAVTPAMMPAARWPSPGGHPLVLLQQAAVNLARSELANGEGIIAVNGPPGTGKSTLLRDIVAACVLDRALAMTAFENPESAFTPTGQRIAAGDKAFFHLYELSSTLKGHEILVASSNNKAVENISKELPAKTAVGRTTNELSYFKTVSDVVHGQRSTFDANEEDNERPADPIETWGLIAAVLGNLKNRAAFQQSFWWHEDCGFRLYLKAAKGDSVVREIKDPETGKITERRTPLVVRAENPPSPQNAIANWRKVKQQFLLLKNEIDAELKALEAVRQRCLEFGEVRRNIASKEIIFKTMLERHSQLESTQFQFQDKVNLLGQKYQQHANSLQEHQNKRPNFLICLFRGRRWKTWSDTKVFIVKSAGKAARLWEDAEQELSKATAALQALTAEIHRADQQLHGLRQQEAQLSEKIEKDRSVLGGRLVDEQFFAQGHNASNLAAPWISDSLHRKREELFIAALNIHKAFIDASAQKVLHNLSVLMDQFLTVSFQDGIKLNLLGDLWSTLFLVVPVLSTTFASVERMLGDLPIGSIGWLLIDEAGQALPQAAVGAVIRSKRSIVVGDPLQIPPVVTLPEKLNFEICKYFKIDKSLWAAPEASAQTLADRASLFQAAFRSDQGPRRVGIPLLVHRRCQEPMFGISNRIAYDGQMVHAPGPRNARGIGEVLGPSSWFNIDGEADSKWCPAEGECVIALVKKIAKAGVLELDLFVITPFRIVAQELRCRLESEDRMFSVFNIQVSEWTNDCVGTIHTVQGREANTVFLVLGAPKASQHGARSWAANTPNILNVAVSRAKQNLYVVGSHGAWSGVGHARELASSLPLAKLYL